MVKKPLTTKQTEFLAEIKRRILSGNSPSWADLAEHFGISHINVIRYINILIEKGYIEKDNTRRPPSIKLL